jgi:hypothetical protein
VQIVVLVEEPAPLLVRLRESRVVEQAFKKGKVVEVKLRQQG